MKHAVSPFLKWAGGKRWFVANHFDLVPSSFDRYIEPFLGSAVMFFKLQPKKAVLADLNKEIITAYLAIRDNPVLVERYLRQHHHNHSKDYFYSVRERVPRSVYSSAARTIYLNRTCWNALYRVNKQGKFNVPIGTKSSVYTESDDFRLVSSVLKNADIIASDFEGVIGGAGKGDFVFVDPPYTVKHNNNGFIKYNDSIFSWSDQLRLRSSVEGAAARGAKVLVTNADHDSIRELYSDFKSIELSRSSVIAGSAKARGRYNELAIQCW